MSTIKARTPRPRRLLDGFPPDTRIVAVGVTWDDYENLVNQVGEARKFRIAFDGVEPRVVKRRPKEYARMTPTAGRAAQAVARRTVSGVKEVTLDR